MQAIKKVRKILATSNNYAHGLDGIENCLVYYFVDNKLDIEKINYNPKKLIIDDYLIGSSRKPAKSLCNDITLDYAANQYLGLIDNNFLNNDIKNAETKYDLKGILYLDHLVQLTGLENYHNMVSEDMQLKDKINLLEKAYSYQKKSPKKSTSLKKTIAAMALIIKLSGKVRKENQIKLKTRYSIPGKLISGRCNI